MITDNSGNRIEGNSFNFNPGNGITINGSNNLVIRNGNLAIGCFGSSNSGTGLVAFIANSCQGKSTTGTAQTITYKYNMP